jgi:glutathione-regulated potassium-efflux system ancillary protein KefG
VRRVLLQFIHPALERSRVNASLLEAVLDLPGVTVNDLYEHYPDGAIDVRREQSLLLEHEAIVFQHPLYWYSSPALFKEWQDLVLEHGFAYGQRGTRLVGKYWLSALSAGGAASSYCSSGDNRFGLRTLLAPFEQTARLCGLRFLPPFVVFGSHQLKTEADLVPHARAYRQALSQLVHGDLAWAESPTAPQFWNQAALGDCAPVHLGSSALSGGLRP